MGPVARVEAVFPLHDHAEMLVVEHDHLDRQLFAVKRGQLLDVHEKTAVAVDVDDQPIGKGGLGAHRGRKAITHRPQPARGDPGARVLEASPLRRPTSDAGRRPWS